MGEFNIENNILVPSRNKYEFLYDMKINESTVLPEHLKIGSLRGAINVCNHKTGFKFVTRFLDGSYRVWRVQ